MTNWQEFPPTLHAAHERIAAIRPGEYARSRNFLDGAVTRLSPYLTHGFVSVPEVLAAVLERQPLALNHRWVMELGWREYFQEVWRHRGALIFQSLRPGPRPEHVYAKEIPEDVRNARTGVPVIDRAVRTLYDHGYLHNHARMWLASYLIHIRQVHWRSGADWMLGYLLDGDLASNHLSWQWVAGTASQRPYLFNADNVARYAPTAWHSPGTVIDTTYEALALMANGASLDETANQHKTASAVLDSGVTPPVLSSSGELAGAGVLVLARLGGVAAPWQGRDVWLIHPWALADPPADLPADCLRLGWWPAEHFARWPWSDARWAFVRERMAAICEVQCWGTGLELALALAATRSIATQDHGAIRAEVPAKVAIRHSRTLFAPLHAPCDSFSSWWRQVTRGVRDVQDLPGLRGIIG